MSGFAGAEVILYASAPFLRPHCPVVCFCVFTGLPLTRGSTAHRVIASPALALSLYAVASIAYPCGFFFSRPPQRLAIRRLAHYQPMIVLTPRACAVSILDCKGPSACTAWFACFVPLPPGLTLHVCLSMRRFTRTPLARL